MLVPHKAPAGPHGDTQSTFATYSVLGARSRSLSQQALLCSSQQVRAPEALPGRAIPWSASPHGWLHCIGTSTMGANIRRHSGNISPVFARAGAANVVVAMFGLHNTGKKTCAVWCGVGSVLGWFASCCVVSCLCWVVWRRVASCGVASRVACGAWNVARVVWRRVASRRVARRASRVARWRGGEVARWRGGVVAWCGACVV